MNKTRGVIFDFNGTLFFDSELHIEAFRHCFGSRNMPVPDNSFIVRNIFGRTTAEIYRNNFNPDPTQQEIDAFIAEKEGTYIQLCKKSEDHTHLCPGAEKLLDTLAQMSIPVAIATGSELETVKFYMDPCM